MRSLWHELAGALRMIHRSPGYAVVVVVTLGLAVGAATTTFSVVDGILLRPLRYREPDRLVSIWEKHPDFPNMAVSYVDFVDWRKEQRTFDDIALIRVSAMTLTGGERAERVEARQVSANWLSVLGVDPY